MEVVASEDGDKNEHNWRFVNDSDKHTLRITSYERSQDIPDEIEKLPFDVEIFRNLIDNICRKFDLNNGENLICFGGCAIFNSDGSLKSIENFLPKYSSVLQPWLQLLPYLNTSFVASRNDACVQSDFEIKKAVKEACLVNNDEILGHEVKIDPSKRGQTEGETHFRVTVPRQKIKPSKVNIADENVENIEHRRSENDDLDQEVDQEGDIVRKTKKTMKHKLKQGLPLPPRPVLSLSQEETQLWFPSFVEKLGGKRYPTSMPRKLQLWDEDVDFVLTSKCFTDLGPKALLDWSSVSATFYWKLKLVAAIILDKQNIDYTTFAETVEEKHEKYSVNDLKLMSMSKNPETFEKLFVKNGFKDKKKPNYLDEFERRSSEIVLQNLRLINARDKRINGNNQPSKINNKKVSQDNEETNAALKLKRSASSTSSADVDFSYSMNPQTLENEGTVPVKHSQLENNGSFKMSKIPALMPISDIVTTPGKKTRGSKPASSKYLCKNNFQKGDYLINSSQIMGHQSPVKLVILRRITRETSKLSVAEFKAVSFNGNEVILERSLNKNRTMTAKFLDSHIKINDSVEIIDKKTIKRNIPKTGAILNNIDKQEEKLDDIDELLEDDPLEIVID